MVARSGRTGRNRARRLAGVGIAVVLAASLPQPCASQSDTSGLAGLWVAKRRFGPDARGPLVIERTGDGYRADMMGYALPVRIEGRELSFALPRGQGAFRGTIEADGAIHGVWFPPRSVAMGGHASPVTLQPHEPGGWRGEVVPYDDKFTFWLLLRRQPDGSLSALLRNPERDFGALLGVERLERNGNMVALVGRRAGQARDVATGWYDAESDVITLTFPSRGGSYDFHRDGDDSDFYPRGARPPRYVYRPPLARNDGWVTGTLEDAGIDRAAAEAFMQLLLELPMDSVNAPQVHGLFLARHGKLVLEEYFHGEHRDKLHDTRSGSKSLTATLVGAAMQAGAPLSPASPVYQVMHGGTVPADLEPRKRAMTLEHLLTMSSGFFCDDSNPDAPGNESTMSNQTDEPDYYRYIMAVPMASAPGDTSVYCSAVANLALGVLSRATGESPLRTFDRLLAGPLKITRYGWPLDPAGQPFGGGSVQLLPRDFMKLGQLMLNGGTWEGRRILSPDFVARASASHTRLGRRGYGYLWWTDEYSYQGRTIGAFAALGAGGNVVIVIRELDLVIATQAGSYSSNGWRYLTGEFIRQYVLPAVR